MSGQFGALMAPSCLVLSVPFCFLLPSFSTIYSESRPKEADTTEDIDKVRILSSIAVSGLGTCDFEELQSYPVGDPSFQRVDEALASHFALASWYRFASAGKSTVDLAKALKADVDRKIVQLSFTGCQNFSDHDMGLLVQNLPGDLRVLRLDLGFLRPRDVEYVYIEGALFEVLGPAEATFHRFFVLPDGSRAWTCIERDGEPGLPRAMVR